METLQLTPQTPTQTMDAPILSTEAPAQTETIIRIVDLWKRYTAAEHRVSLRHEAGDIFKRLLRVAAESRPQNEPFYALRAINLTVQRGESLAIIGRNGSGKTTLLRLLSGITKPTQGSIEVNGRYASLIALGAGFNPEMSGRENIFLNAAIQGVHPRDTKALVPAITEFADIGAFIDIPVKRYSSGMHARLGFSIAMHILPDIVFVDEVLAVGDEAFQEKCNLKMEAFRAEGRTIVLVTHSGKTVKGLADRAIWLNRGALMMEGAPDAVLKAYQESFAQP